MADKDWIGADLIFDLDGDHLPGVTDRDFPGMINVIQEQAFTLWNDYLEPEFGFDENTYKLLFLDTVVFIYIIETPHYFS